MKRNTRGFTLVEILIVVIILGILAAIVIPQFTNASNDARNNSVSSTLQTLRSQIELYKIQHNDTAPPQAALWAQLTTITNAAGTTSTTIDTTNGFIFGPYLQQAPKNPLNNLSAVGAAAASNVGWVYTASGSQYSVNAVDANGALTTY